MLDKLKKIKITRKTVTVTLIVGLVGLFGLWVGGEVAYSRTVPFFKEPGTILSSKADQILKRSCFDCHSYSTKYPWYARMPIANLILGHHVEEGREELNFSRWDTFSPKKQVRKMGESLRHVKKKDMPMASYTWLHQDARVSKADLDLLIQVAKQKYGKDVMKKKKRRKSKNKKDDEKLIGIFRAGH